MGVFLAILVAGGIWLSANSQAVSDFWRAQNYRPSAEISGIVSRIRPTSAAQTVFYANQPRVLASEEFNRNCSNLLEKTSVLGCYKNGSTYNDSIYIFDVQNQDLDGIKEVTAAHELLHAIWARMDNEERAKLGELLQAEYQRVKTDKLETTMKGYEISEPGEENNELHSILGTEFGNLSSELEAHYAKYFQNRGEIVAMNAKYQAKFSELSEKAASLNSELKTLENEINSMSADYRARLENLNRAIASFNARAQSGDFNSEAAFYSERQNLVSAGNYLENYRVQINSKVADYNSKAQELSQIASEIQQLYNSMNSKIEEVEKVDSI